MKDRAKRRRKDLPSRRRRLAFESLERRRLLAIDPNSLLEDLDGENGFYVSTASGLPPVSIKSIGDINHDGFDDLGYLYYWDNGSGSYLPGESGILWGHEGSRPPILEFESLTTTQRLVIQDSRPGLNLDELDSWPVEFRKLGDVNGDGIDDLAILVQWQPGIVSNESLYGLFVLHGKDGALGSNGIFDLKDFGPSDGSILYSGPLGEPRDHILDVVAGDIDSDGFSDLHVVWSNLKFQSSLRTWIDTYYGSSGGFPSMVRLDQLAAEDRTRYTSDPHQFLGSGFVWMDQGIDFGGDLNGDGLSDLVIGGLSLIQRQDPVFVVYGGSERCPPEMDLDHMQPLQGLKILGENNYAQFGVSTTTGDSFGSSVSFAGDVSGDGIDDLLIGQWQGTDRLKQGTGAFFVVFGKAGGWSSGVLDVRSASAGEVIEFYGVNRRSGSETFGSGLVTSVSSAGDLTGDGIDDFLVVASLERTELINPSTLVGYGGVYLIHGGSHLTTKRDMPRPDVKDRLGDRLRISIPGSKVALDFVEGSFDFDGDGNPDFLLASLCKLSACGIMPEDARQEARVILDPFGLGRRSGPEITVSDTGGGGVTSNGEVDFGTVPYLSNINWSKETLVRSFEITNRGSGDLVVNAAQFVSGNGFEILANVPNGTVLASGEKTQITVRMLSDVVGLREAVLRIPNSDADEGSFDIRLNGVVVDAGKLQLSVNGTVLPDSGGTIDFGSAAAASSGTIRTVTLTNVGTVSTGINSALLQENSGFSLVTNVANNVSLPAGGSVSIKVQMNTDVAGDRAARLRWGTLSAQLVGSVETWDAAPRLESLEMSPDTVPGTGVVRFLATFSEPVVGVDANDFVPSGAGGVGFGALTTVGLTDRVYEVTVQGVSGTGTLRLRLQDDGSIRDAGGQQLTGGFSSDLQSSLAVDGLPVGTLARDLDGDGVTDIATVNRTSKKLSVFRGMASGGFATVQEYLLTSEPVGVFAGDVVEDGRQDLLVVTQTAGLRIFKGMVDGSYSELGSVNSGITEIIDFNSDGHLDLVVAGFTTSGYLPGRGDGTFGAAVNQRIASGGSGAVADIDGDGDLDILNASGKTGYLSFGEGPNPFAFGVSSSGTTFTKNVAHLSLPDLDGDAIVDVVYTTLEANQVLIRSKVSGADIAYDTGGSPSGLVIADTNSDGWLDVVVAHLAQNRVSVLLNRGDGTFDAAQVIDVGTTPAAIAIAEVTRDGRPDLIVANRDASQVTILPGVVGPNATVVTIGQPEFIAKDEIGRSVAPNAVILFETARTDGSPTRRSIFVRNTSNVNLVLQPAALVSGTGFRVVQNLAPGQTLAPGESFELIVELENTTAGVFNGTLRWTSNDPAQPQFEVLLQGQVIAPVEILVTNTADAGPGSLRQAILDANQTSGDATIRFAIPTSDPRFEDIDSASGLAGADAAADVYRIRLLSSLPAINNQHGQRVTIRGTQASNTNPFGPEIVLDGDAIASNAYGLTLQSAGIVVEDLGIESFKTWGILSHGNQALISNVYVGVDALGQSGTGAARGIEVRKAGTEIRDSVIAGHSGTEGAIDLIESSNVRLVGNHVGVDRLGGSAIGNAGPGVRIQNSSNTLLESNVISGNTLSGVEFTGTLAAGLTLHGNIIGLSADGTIALPNQGPAGVWRTNGAKDTMIGGLTSEAGNVIAGNTGFGVKLEGDAVSHDVVTGNWIGVNRSGTVLGNGGTGLHVGPIVPPQGSTAKIQGNRVEGNQGNGVETAVPQVQVLDNVVSGNRDAGLVLLGSAIDATVQGNRIGVNLAGTLAVPNGGAGVILGAARTLLGGHGAGEGNVISGNVGVGIVVEGTGATDNRIVGNRVGTDLSGVLDLGNGAGILTQGTGSVLEGNHVAFNHGTGIEIGWFETRLIDNVIAKNTGLGIDLGGDGPTANDLQDKDAGPNGLINAPVIEGITRGTETQVRVAFAGEPNANVVLRLFANQVSDPAKAQGEVFLAIATVQTDADGFASHLFILSTGSFAGRVFTATASDVEGRSSEFSAGVAYEAVTRNPPRLLANANGFTLEFDTPIDVNELQLYSGTVGATEVPDLTLVGEQVGAVRGSLVVSGDGRRLTFVSSGGPLTADRYTVSARSGASGVRHVGGALMDGNGDGVLGDDFAGTFDITPGAANEVVLSLPNFVRGRGQAVNLPNQQSAGVPVTVSDTRNVNRVSFEVRYDPALLTVTGFTPAVSNWNVAFSAIGAGRVRVVVEHSEVFQRRGGAMELGRLIAAVPSDAPYRGRHAVELVNVRVETISELVRPSRGDAAVHVASFSGDTSGDGNYSSGDVTLIQRLIVGTQTGLNAYRLVDPLVVGDTNGSTGYSSADAVLVQRLIVGLPVNQLPPLPNGAVASPESTLSAKAVDPTTMWSGLVPASMHTGADPLAAEISKRDQREEAISIASEREMRPS